MRLQLSLEDVNVRCFVLMYTGTRYEPRLKAAAATVKDDLMMSTTLEGCVVL